jgi:hypothetical protein
MERAQLRRKRGLFRNELDKWTSRCKKREMDMI